MRILPDIGIPLPDGTRLSARVWMPDGAEQAPVPAILEYLPYRKSDGTAARDHGMHLHFARAGYACLRVDRRGCGESGGLFDDEYSETELQDGVEVIRWIAAQPWCSGRVGIQGISWGGFNGLQIAARAPEALRAVISIGTTVDRYHDDIHYKGGVQLGENAAWAATVMSWFSMPPDPDLVGEDRWRAIWQDRIGAAPFLAGRWMRHPDRDAYWRHGSVCEDFAAIRAPVLVMGGLHDGYRNAMAALLRGCPAPVRAITGPWSHKYPHLSTIGPAIDYPNEALRWWDRWLKDVDTGVEEDPAYRVYAMESVAPDPALTHRPGRWLGLSGDPDAAARLEDLALGPTGLGRAGAFSATIAPDLACGEACGEFFPFGFGPGELPDDQAPDDARSLCFDGPALEREETILGAPQVTLRVTSDSPRAQVIARLCDLRPDGSSALITLGVLNLRHRAGFATKEDLVPGEICEVTVPLDQSAYRLPAGHRLRLALSSSYWPYCWPEGEAARLTVTGGTLRIPWLRNEAARPVDFDPPPALDARSQTRLRETHEAKTWRTDPATGTRVLEITGDHGRIRDEMNGLVTESAVTERWEITGKDPATAAVEIVWTRALGRGDWQVSSRVTTRVEGRAESFEITQRLEAWDCADQVADRTFDDSVPR